jgi:short-subunit dehydrogenase
MKYALITGASDGIGASVAKLLAKKGWAVTLVARSEDKLRAIVQGLPGHDNSYLIADLSTQEGLNSTIQQLGKKRYEVLVNNAGVGIYKAFTDPDLDELLKMIDLNIKAVVVLSYHFLKVAQKGDAIINTGSILGIGSKPGAAVYAGTKAFVTTFSEGLWYEAKKKGVYTSGFNPGPVESDFHKRAGGSDQSYPKIMLQKPEQVARELVKALAKRKKPRIVAGALNRYLLFMQRLISRKAVVSIMGRIAPLK